jgi:hypothetical protein
MESEAKAGRPRKESARACPRRGAGATGPEAVKAVCRAHPTRRRAMRRRGGRGLRVVAERKAKGGPGCPVSHPEHGDTPILLIRHLLASQSSGEQ